MHTIYYAMKFWYGVMISIAVAVFPPEAAAHDWHRFGPADSPARVKAIVFPGGDHLVIDATRILRWGQWTVEFGNTAPIATYLSESAASWVITGLLCQNPVAGAHICFLRLAWATDAPDLCRFSADDSTDKGFEGFSVRCPTELRFED